MKKLFRKSQLGSIMIEALSMLGLIALVTPVLYKKAAERTSELQDINAASEMRTIIKAVDDYISSNYDAIVAGQTITNTCANSVKTKSYSAFAGQNDAQTTVPIGHFCEFLPYGILNADGTAQNSRFFSSSYQVVLKLKGSNDVGDHKGDKVVTAFVITDPRQDMPTVRSSSIASMIGGNGGYVSEVKSNKGGTVLGNLGLWGVADTKTELGVEAKKGAIVAASIQGISSQNANIDLEGVLYRQRKDDSDLNTMSTTLFMGQAGTHNFGHNIENVGKIILGEDTVNADNTAHSPSGYNATAPDGSTNTDRLYLKEGSIRIRGNGNFNIDGTGNVILNQGAVRVGSSSKVGNIIAGYDGSNANKEPSLKTSGQKGNVFALGEIHANKDIFNVANDGIVTGFTYIARKTASATDTNVAVKINAKDTTDTRMRSTFNQPLEVIAADQTGADCVGTSHKCAFYVEGDAKIKGNMTITETFSAKNLHAQEKLTVGGTTPGTGPALTVDYNSDKPTLSFGNDLLKITKSNTGSDNPLGSMNFGGFINANKTSSARTFMVGDKDSDDTVKQATRVYFRTTGNDIFNIGVNGIQATASTGSQFTLLNDGSATIAATKTISLQDTMFKLDTTDTNSITSIVKKFVIAPNKETYGKFQIDTTGTYGRAVFSKLNTYFTGAGPDADKSFVVLQNSDFYMKDNAGTRIIHMSDTAGGTNNQIDVSPTQVTMSKNGALTTKILKIDLDKETDAASAPENYPVYIRKGAIEVGNNSDGKELNYVKADRFVAHKALDADAIRNYSGASTASSTYDKYEVNPAYTSVMHDIKLTTRGGARLSDILPDFINKGIYIVDNTYPENKQKCNNTGTAGVKMYDYMTRALVSGKGYKNLGNIPSCNLISDKVSPWAGFVPAPTCPPGYSRVITIMPTSFSMAHVGRPVQHTQQTFGNDVLEQQREFTSPYDYSEGAANAPLPLYYQINTWLKTFAIKYPHFKKEGSGDSATYSLPDSCDGVTCNCRGTNCKGWDVGIGFIYPLAWYDSYATQIGGTNLVNLNREGEKNGDNDTRIVWNLFPVYAGTLEGYATVYCYFSRKGVYNTTTGETTSWNTSLVDTTYDQLESYRAPNSKTTPSTDSDIQTINLNYKKRLNAVGASSRKTYDATPANVGWTSDSAKIW